MANQLKNFIIKIHVLFISLQRFNIFGFFVKKHNLNESLNISIKFDLNQVVYVLININSIINNGNQIINVLKLNKTLHLPSVPPTQHNGFIAYRTSRVTRSKIGISNCTIGKYLLFV